MAFSAPRLSQRVTAAILHFVSSDSGPSPRMVMVLAILSRTTGFLCACSLSRVSLNCEHRLTLRTAVRRLNTCRPGASSTRSKATFTTYSGSLCTYTVQQMHAPNLLSITHTGSLRDARTGRAINGYTSDDHASDSEDEEALSEFPHVVSGDE